MIIKISLRSFFTCVNIINKSASTFMAYFCIQLEAYLSCWSNMKKEISAFLKKLFLHVRCHFILIKNTLDLGNWFFFSYLIPFSKKAKVSLGSNTRYIIVQQILVFLHLDTMHLGVSKFVHRLSKAKQNYRISLCTNKPNPIECI